ncbi:hypothetical protein O1611_g7246 [Lasiodiplodia mahajangana]|uniref:Uncharacterized protein n=1 Tax=Lasiodiplodia mahajangana TaxID=1108764 RepID=A0ACC2JFW0_9PEZI|nr:hypothetical protein O1611_g7246 [Lasiodiplodia mahajangana]
MVPNSAPLTGTSYATSIAAGLAAKLIDFSRQESPDAPIRAVESLRTFEGMAAVFKTMVGERTLYNCLRPWKLLEYAEPAEARHKMRQRVRDIMSHALERRYDDAED